MFTPRFGVTLALALATVSPAQTFTSPTGFDQIEGDSAHFALFHRSYGRFMQIDATQSGPVANIQALRLRRDGDLVSPTGGPRTTHLTVLMGHANFSAITGTFASNYSSPPTTVFTRKPVSTPDWSRLSTRPAPFDFRAAFDTPWSFNGSDALVFELHMENVSQLGSPNVDRELGASSTFTQTFAVSTNDGCIVSGQLLPMTHSLTLQNHGVNHQPFGMRLVTSLIRGPIGQPAVMNFDIRDQNITLPGLCSPLHAMPGATINLPATNAFGNIDPINVDLAYTRSLVNRTLVTQVVTLDPGQPGFPAALSDARIGAMPNPPRPSPRAAYLYAATPTTPTATLWADRAVIASFEY